MVSFAEQLRVLREVHTTGPYSRLSRSVAFRVVDYETNDQDNIRVGNLLVPHDSIPINIWGQDSIF